VDVTFDNPASWGYCPHCGFVVTVDPESGLMVSHDRMRPGVTDFQKKTCGGGGLEPTEQPGPDIEPPAPPSFPLESDDDGFD